MTAKPTTQTHDRQTDKICIAVSQSKGSKTWRKEVSAQSEKKNFETVAILRPPGLRTYKNTSSKHLSLWIKTVQQTNLKNYLIMRLLLIDLNFFLIYQVCIKVNSYPEIQRTYPTCHARVNFQQLMRQRGLNNGIKYISYTKLVCTFEISYIIQVSVLEIVCRINQLHVYTENYILYVLNH